MRKICEYLLSVEVPSADSACPDSRSSSAMYISIHQYNEREDARPSVRNLYTAPMSVSAKTEMPSETRKWKLHRRCDAKWVAARGAAKAPMPGIHIM